MLFSNFLFVVFLFKFEFEATIHDVRRHFRTVVLIMDVIVPRNNEAVVNNPFMELARTVIQHEHYSNVLSVQMFVTRTQFNIDPLFVDEQWAMMNTQRSDELNILTTEMIQRLNFATISKLIKKLSVLFPGNSKDYIGDGKNVVITTHKLNKLSGSLKLHGGKRYHKEIKMTKNAYKELIMESQTESARQVRKYYICLEDLFTQYLLYQRAHEIVLSTHRMEILTMENKELSNKLDHVIAISESQVQKLDTQSQKLDMLSKILHKETDNKVVDVTDKTKKQELMILQNKTEPTRIEVLRGQVNHLNQVKRKRNDMEVVGKIDSYKNPINLLNRFNESIKKQGDERFSKTNNKIVLKNGSTVNDLMHVFHDLDEDKHTVANDVRKCIS